LAKKEIKLQYSGAVIFAAKLISVITGMVFTLLVTRNATKEQYGVWTNVFDILAYFALLASVLPFWATRYVARGEKGAAKTGIVANFLISLASMAIYLPLVPLITLLWGISGRHPDLVVLYFIAALQIVNVYLINALEAVLRSQRPQAVGYGLLLEEVCKVTLAFVTIVVLNQLLVGAMISLITATAIQVVYYLGLVSEDFKEKIRWDYAREWLKGSIVNIYAVVGIQLSAAIFLLLFSFGGEAAKGDYGAAMAIANIITYSFFLSFALYPKLLAENSLKEITTSLKMVLMFAIPMAAGAMAIPESFLTILAEPYREAAPVLFFLAIDSVVVTLTNFFTFVVFGVEKIDEKSKIPLKRLAKSNIFKVSSLSYVHSAISLPTAFYLLTTLKFAQPYEAAICVTIINLIARLAMFLILCAIARKTLTIHVPWVSIAKYVLCAALMGISLYLLPHPDRITTTLATAVAGGLAYFALLMLIDKDSRALIKYGLEEIRTSLKPSSD
jgi:O-antigen/teichoic acid export membrane protein